MVAVRLRLCLFFHFYCHFWFYRPHCLIVNRPTYVFLCDLQWTSTKWRCSRVQDVVPVLMQMFISHSLAVLASLERDDSARSWKTTLRPDRKYNNHPRTLLVITKQMAKVVSRWLHQMWRHLMNANKLENKVGLQLKMQHTRNATGNIFHF